MSPQHPGLKRSIADPSPTKMTKAKTAKIPGPLDRSLTNKERQILEQAATILGTSFSQLPSQLANSLTVPGHAVRDERNDDVVSGAFVTDELPANTQGKSFEISDGAINELLDSANFDFDPDPGDIDIQYNNPFSFSMDNGLAVSDNCFRLFASETSELQFGNALFSDSCTKGVADLPASNGVIPETWSWDWESMDIMNSSTDFVAGYGEAQPIPCLDFDGRPPDSHLEQPSLTTFNAIELLDLTDVPFSSAIAQYSNENDAHMPETINDSVFEGTARHSVLSGNSTGATPQGIIKQPGRRGPFKDLDERAQTGITRRLGACIRCRMQKIRCIPDDKNRMGPCITCQLASTTLLTKSLCIRKKVTDATLFAKGAHPQFRWSQRWETMEIADINNWASPETKIVHITQDVTGVSYELRVRQFVPLSGDSTSRFWVTRGMQKSYPCTNYAIEDMKRAGQSLLESVNGSIEAFIDFYIDKTDWLLHETYRMALRYSTLIGREDEEELLCSVLRLWVSIRMESRSERICGRETLSMESQNFDPECSNFGQVLIPPVMSAQIELVTTVTLLQPLKKTVLGGLKKLIEKNRTQSWFTVYLCLFILLHSCALLTSFEHSAARKYGLLSRYVYDNFIKELHHGSTILLSYFHYCNKGSNPLLMDWDTSPDVVLAELSPIEMDFLKKTSQEVRKKNIHFKAIHLAGAFEDPYFFLSQLYNPNWRPLETI